MCTRCELFVSSAASASASRSPAWQPRRAFLLAAAGAALAGPALAQVNVGNASMARNLVPADRIEAAGVQQYGQLLQQARAKGALAGDGNAQLQRLRTIANRLIPFATPWNTRAREWKWEVNLIGSKQINAFCMPGGKIAFFTGILEQLKLSDDEVAMVMGHEMAHALREHARARLAKSAGTGAALSIGAQLGPLAGLRFAVKDNIDVAGVPTTAACPPSLPARRARGRGAEAARCRCASLLGKTNLDQFACGLNGTRSPYGAVPNAFDPRYVSGGSSSGSAYVVATGQVDFALGTDTAGSGRVPAGLNNIVGLKPSRGLLSAFGVVPAAQSVGLRVDLRAHRRHLAVDVLLAAMGHDARDPYSRELRWPTGPLPAAFRFGVPDTLSFFGDAAGRSRPSARPSRGCCALGGTPVTIDYAPLAEAAALLYESALVAERYAAVRDLLRCARGRGDRAGARHPRSGRGYSAADLFEAQTSCARSPAGRRRCGRHRRAAGADRAHALHDRADARRPGHAEPQPGRVHQLRQPARLRRALGAEQPAPDGLPFGITLIGPAAATGSWPNWASAITTPPACRRARPAAAAGAAAIPGMAPSGGQT
jgi:Asp-tRNA(Asn)/Glu-tRNA(Gln) amidotransferase A subunit family amidase